MMKRQLDVDRLYALRLVFAGALLVMVQQVSTLQNKHTTRLNTRAGWVPNDVQLRSDDKTSVVDAQSILDQLPVHIATHGKHPPLNGNKFKTFEDMVSSFHEEPLLILFTAVNCGPCKLQKREIVAARNVVGNQFKVYAIETEKWPQVGSRYAVGKLPCLMVMKNKEVLLRLEGLVSADDLVKQLGGFYQ